jgi:hypothetical protein
MRNLAKANGENRQTTARKNEDDRMTQNNVDLCNPLAVWQLFIQFLSGTTPAAASPPPSNLSATLPPPLLREPILDVRPKPGTGIFQVGKYEFALDDLSVRPDAVFNVVKEFSARADAEAFVQATPRIRLPGRLRYTIDEDNDVTTLPDSLSFDWRGDPDAVRTMDRLNEIMTRIPLFDSLPDSRLVTLVMALLPAEATGLHRPDPRNPARSFVLIDPFKVEKGVLEMAATYIHELTHAKFYHDRGFDSLELIPLLSRGEYMLVYLEDELACFNNEVKAVRQFLSSCSFNLQEAASGWIATTINPPAAFYFTDMFASEPPTVLEDLARQVVVDFYLSLAKASYARIRGSALAPGAAARAWLTSAERTATQGTLPMWTRAGLL